MILFLNFTFFNGYFIIFHDSDDDDDDGVRNCRQIEDQQKLELSQLQETIATLQKECDCLKSEKVITPSCNKVVFLALLITHYVTSNYLCPVAC